MDEHVQKKLLKLGYDPEKISTVTSRGIIPVSQGFLGGLVLFAGRVTAHAGHSYVQTVLEDDHMTMSGSIASGVRSFYVRPLEGRIKEEYLRVVNIQPNDSIYTLGECVTQHRETFSLVIDDARKNNILTLEFWVREDMLYVPKRA